MYLKSIELYGFKSFATKMIFKFNTGITGIVGPNGSGKSNIADAVRWVLGEQSAKQLRGSKMEDVIFAGTQARKSLGYCQVDLTIDNQDKKMPIEYTEVTISRRVYRSGESEYCINGTPCRLKDIQELFMDTGVGKEGYSIIGQGQIDKILSTKPDDRRDLFDEAAGIVKFKKRRQSAEKKLEEEKQNLIRINDIIRELEGQKETLEIQSETAKKYLDYKEQLKRYDLNIFLSEYEKLNQNIDDINKKEKQLQDEIEEVKKEYSSIKDKYSNRNNEIENIAKQIEDEKQKVNNILIEKEKKEASIELTKEKIKNLLDNNNRINKELDELEQKIKNELEDKKQFKIKSEEIENEINQIEQKTNEKQLVYNEFISNIEEEEKKIENIQTNIIERLNNISNVRSKIQRLQTMLENTGSRKDSISSRRRIIESTINSIGLDVKKTVSEIDSLEHNQNQLSEKKLQLKKSIYAKEEERKKYEYEINESNKKLHIIKSKYNALKDISDHYEGYNYSIKKIMEYKNSSSEAKGVMGVIADIIKVEKMYETAIEIALGGNIQNIVTDNESTAKKMINYLKTNKLGRATFLPLTSIKSREVYNRITNKEEGFIGYANELVDYDNKYSNIIEYLLGRIIIVDNIDNAIKLSKKFNYSLRIVTLAGELINPGGALTGGAFKNKGNQFLSRKRDLDQFEVEIDKISAFIKKLEPKMITILKEQEEYNNSLEEIINNEQEIKLELNSYKIKLKQLENEINKYGEEIEDINSELKQLSNQENDLRDSINNHKEALEGTETENEDAESLVKSISESINTEKIKRDKLSGEITKLKIDSSTIKQQLSNYKENITRLDRDIINIQNNINRNNEAISKNEEEIEENEQTIKACIQTINNYSNTIEITSNDIESLSIKKREIVKKQEILLENKDELSERINLLEKDILRLQNSKIKYEVQNESHIEYIWEEYEFTYKMALEYKEETLGTITSMKKEHNMLKDKIRKLGDVNVNAIEDFRIVSDRYAFLSEQKEDLILAEEKLKKVINELNIQMTNQFKEKFYEINLKFEEVFKELFGGGKAILELTEEDNVLESGIKIIASPPGKKLQSMMLLSGGERAFTAIALLFAIQSLKPSPFCVLDEIEAALDDANVERFAQYLKKLSNNTQFIIITHRKGTMEVADALYGITMQEKGVSTQVSVKLIENELDDSLIE